MATTLEARKAEAREVRFSPPSYTTVTELAKNRLLIHIENDFFTPENAQDIVRRFPTQEAIDAMVPFIQTDQGTEAAIKIANGYVEGEEGRVMGLSRTMFPISYGYGFEILKAAGIDITSENENIYEVDEIGPSMGAHVGYFEKKGIRSYIGREIDTPFAEGGKIVVRKTVRSPKYEIIEGDENTRLKKPSRIRVNSFVIQYSLGEHGARKLAEDCDIEISADTAHGTSPIYKGELESGYLPIRSTRSPGLNTGMAYKIRPESARKSVFGISYEITMALDDEVFGRNPNIVPLFTDRDNYNGKITIIEKDGEKYTVGWAMEATDKATSEETKYVKAICNTIIECYTELGAATRRNPLGRPVRKEQWGANGIAALPAYGAEAGLPSAVVLTIPENVPARFLLNLLRRNSGNLETITAAGLFSEIGEGKTFRNVGELITKLDELRLAPDFDKKFTFHAPVLPVVMTGKREIIEKLAA